MMTQHIDGGWKRIRRAVRAGAFRPAKGVALAALTFALVSTLPVSTAMAQDQAAASSVDRWVEIAIVAGLVVVLGLLKWMERPMRANSGVFSRSELEIDPSDEFRLSSWASGAVVEPVEPDNEDDPRRTLPPAGG